MLSILLTILVALLIMAAFYWVVSMIPLPPPFKQIALAVCALFFLIWLLNILGAVGSPWRLHVGV